MNKKMLAAACAAVLGLSLTACSTVSDTATKVKDTVVETVAPTPEAPELHAAMRGLWHDHIVATRDYALAVHDGNQAAATQAENAAVANAQQIADAVNGFYDGAGPQTLELLGGHWGGVKNLTLASKAGNTNAERQAMDGLAQNALDISRFLAAANPNWTETDLQTALLMHVGDHRQQITDIMADAPADEQEALWTDMQHHMDMIADALSDGIAKQFPDKVK